MNNDIFELKPVLITRQTIQDLLGGISRSTFWRRRKKWKDCGTPFPSPAPDTNPIKGGEQYKYADVMRFFERQGLTESTHEEI